MPTETPTSFDADAQAEAALDDVTRSPLFRFAAVAVCGIGLAAGAVLLVRTAPEWRRDGQPSADAGRPASRQPEKPAPAPASSKTADIAAPISPPPTAGGDALPSPSAPSRPQTADTERRTASAPAPTAPTPALTPPSGLAIGSRTGPGNTLAPPSGTAADRPANAGTPASTSGGTNTLSDRPSGSAFDPATGDPAATGSPRPIGETALLPTAEQPRAAPARRPLPSAAAPRARPRMADGSVGRGPVRTGRPTAREARSAPGQFQPIPVPMGSAPSVRAYRFVEDGGRIDASGVRRLVIRVP